MSDEASRTTTSKGFFISLSVDFMRKAISVQQAADFLFGRMSVAAALAELPEDMALRARLAPDLFKARA